MEELTIREADKLKKGNTLIRTRKDTEKAIYVLMMGVLLIEYIYLIIWGVGISSIPMITWIMRIVTAVLAIHIGKLWRDKGFLLLSVFLLYMFFRVFIPKPADVFHPQAAENFLTGIWMCAGCYGLARILNEKELKRFLSLIIFVFTAGMTVYSIIGLKVAWTGIEIAGPGLGNWRLYQNRLALIYLPTASGAILGLSFVIAIITLFCSKSCFCKVFYGIASFIFLFTLALTDSRTAFICVGVGCASLYGLAIVCLFRNRNLKKWILCTGVVLGMVCIFALSLWGFRALTAVFNQAKIHGGILVQKALAETNEAEDSLIHTQGYFVDGGLYLSGRKEIWIVAINDLKAKPWALIVGKSVIIPLGDNRWIKDYAHCHNIILQMIIENGIIGSLPLFAFIIIVLKRSIRMIKDKNISMWLCFVPAIIIMLLVGDMAECYTWFRSSQCQMGAVLFIVMGIVSCYGRKLSARNNNEQMPM